MECYKQAADVTKQKRIAGAGLALAREAGQKALRHALEEIRAVELTATGQRLGRQKYQSSKVGLEP